MNYHFISGPPQADKLTHRLRNEKTSHQHHTIEAGGIFAIRHPDDIV